MNVKGQIGKEIPKFKYMTDLSLFYLSKNNENK